MSTRRWECSRDDDGHIVEPATRSGTPALVPKEYPEERQCRKALH